MPELPEVETIKNELAPHVIGERILAVTILWDKIVRQPSANEFRRHLVGQEVTGIARRGKYLLFSLKNSEKLLVLHLKMSGSLLLATASTEPPAYTRAILWLDNGNNIFFRDPRKFGRLWLVNEPAEAFGKLGPEPFEEDFTPERLAGLLQGRKAPVKALLLDQDLIAGIGNLYADEALFAAGIYPLRPGASLTADEVRQLHQAIREVLMEGIKNKGASIVNYYRPSGDAGHAHEEFKVAHRRGENCPVCGTTLSYIKVRGRGTYFCPQCQRE
ncbi:MAG: DNA-formamidopyrimidine glycosylase [Chloroflexi bacterium]|nr:DNA-formamidopyrimidine glycosylase [Chloroflexota bacterium]